MKISWDICPHFHGMNDFGHDGQGGFTRSYTYTAECYAIDDKKHCQRQGQCVVANSDFVPSKVTPICGKADIVEIILGYIEKSGGIEKVKSSL